MIFKKQILFLLLSIIYSCSTILPKEKRIHKSEIYIDSSKSVSDYVDSKYAKKPNRIMKGYSEENKVSLKYYREELLPNNSYISCKFVLKKDLSDELIFESMSFIINYGKIPKSTYGYIENSVYSAHNDEGNFRRVMEKGGIIGPKDDKELEEILLPCIKEFINI